MIEQINDFIESQLAVWPEAAERYMALGKVRRRQFKIGDFEGAFQYNPARIVSTGANINSETISKRPCFLCGINRPPEQMAISLSTQWKLLLNPFPILPVHLTIVNEHHLPQENVPIEIAAIAERLPGLCVFFNGSNAGASAPDHLHLQAILKDELPIIRLTEKIHSLSDKGVMRSDMWGLDLPFIFLSAVITDDEEGEQDYMQLLAMTGANPDTGRPDKGLRNFICWKDLSGLLRIIVIPRTAHRPQCYGYKEENLLVSPGTIDMGGLVILPREEDYNKITPEDIRIIYKETGVG